MTAYQLCIPGWWVVAVVTLLLCKFGVEMYVAVRIWQLVSEGAKEAP